MSLIIRNGNGTGYLANVDVNGSLQVAVFGTASLNITQVGGVTLGNPTAWGTAPTGNVLGVNAELFAGNTAITATGTSVNANITNTVPVTLTSTTITGTVAVTQSGTWTNRIVGSTGATLDGTVVAGTAPTNALATLVVNQTTAPSLTTGQSVAAQADYVGSQFVKPYRRSQSVAGAATITTSTSPVTLIAAQASGIFADIGSLVITVAAGAVSNTSFTVTLSDGTASYIFDVFTGSLATITDSPTVVSANFNPPIPATSAATAWTVTSSSATPTLHCVATAVLQKAS
jgi:hypothetical protein